MTTYLGKICSFGLPRVPFENCRQFMYLVISLLVLRAGCGIWLYQFLIIAYLFTFHLWQHCSLCWHASSLITLLPVLTCFIDNIRPYVGILHLCQHLSLCWYTSSFVNISPGVGVLHLHHHHIHFRALFSSTEGWAFWQVFLEGVLSTQNNFEGQQNPYLASFCHSQVLHPMISLACQIFSVQPHSACVLLQSSLCCSTCPNHLILLVRSTTSKSWMPSFVRRESELTSSFALTLQIQRIMARSLRRRRFSVSTFMAQVSAACSITLLTHDEYTLPLVRRGRWRLVRRGSNWRNLPHAHLQRVIAASLQPPPAESMSPR